MIGESVSSWPRPRVGAGVTAGVVVVLGFTVVHGLFIADIWFNAGPMLIAGALCGFCIVWSYRASVVAQSTGSWFRYASLYAIEMLVLGAVSLVVLRPQFTMAELLVADDAFQRLLPPSAPLLIGAMVVGTAVVWLVSGRQGKGLVPILVTHVLLVFLLGHQFAFLGLVESSSAVMVAFGEFAVITFGLSILFSLGAVWATALFERASTRGPVT